MDIFTVKNKKEEKFLRQKTAHFDFSKYSKKEIRELIKTMRQVMKDYLGIGLSANQIGLNIKVFVAQVANKFYSVFNPEIIEYSSETSPLEEGCLSIPETFGKVERPEKVILVGQGSQGKKIKIKAWGLLARVFQHETDHLNGKLFIDRAKSVKRLESSK